MAVNRFLFVIGGARSGKSDFALGRGLASTGPVTFIATASALDDDMAQRIDRHQAERPDHWGLIEEPIDLLGAIRSAGANPETLLIVDCLTVWTSNLMFAQWSEDKVLAEASKVTTEIQRRSGPTVVISNEVGLGVHPETELGRTYRDLLGRVNQTMAASADRALFFAAGRAFELHDPAELLESPK